jgi:hypothetical protein
LEIEAHGIVPGGGAETLFTYGLPQPQVNIASVSETKYVFVLKQLVI